MIPIPAIRLTEGRDYKWLLERTLEATAILSSEMEHALENHFGRLNSEGGPDWGIIQDDSGDYAQMAMDSIKFAERWLSHEGEPRDDDWTLGRIRDFSDAIKTWELETEDYFGDIRDAYTDDIPEDILDYLENHGSC